MIFTTFQFLIFFLAVFPLFFALRGAGRYRLLLAASYYFYMCSIPWYLTVIIAITLVDFFAGLRIERAPTPRARSMYLTLSILCNFGILVAFKYAGFFAGNINEVLGVNLPVLRYILPLGISFHTFQAVSYTIEVYRGRVVAERSLLRYALYVAFFPQMVAGPIERPYNLLRQFHVEQRLSCEGFSSGLRVALWGLFKKSVVADLLAPAVNTVFGQPEQASGPILILGAVFFMIQIYCDFSGYSDIAIGIARMMGFDLMVNFRQPYLSRSVGEFWTRWHISLSSWFRDYVYFPLGGGRVPAARRYFNLLIVFFLSGLWHGASWTFAVWGLIHWFYMVLGSVTAPIRLRLRSAVGLSPSNPALVLGQVVTTFSLVTLAQVFFRAPTIRSAVHMISHMPDWRGFKPASLFTLGLPRFEMASTVPLIAAVFIVDWALLWKPPLILRLWSARPFRWACYYLCAYSVVFLGVFERVEFIYFQF